jgi:MFS family permease
VVVATVRRERVALALAVWAVLVSQVLVYPGVADLVGALGGSGELDAATAFLLAEFAAFVAFAGLWGALSDALGRRVPLVVAGALGGAAAAVALATVGPGASWPTVLALRALSGAATIGAFSLSITMLADLAGGSGRNLGAAGVAIGLGAALGSVVGGRLTAIDPLAPLYGTAALLGAVALLAATVRDRAPGRTTPDAEAAGDREGRGAAEATRSPGGLARAIDGVRERPGLLVPFAFGLVDRTTAGFLSLVGVFYFRETFDLDATGAGLVLAAFFAPFALLQYPLGRLSDRVGRVRPVVAGSVLYGVAIAGVGVAPTLPLAVAGMVLVGVAGALVAPATMALVVDVAGPDGRGVALGGFNAFGSVGFLAGFAVGGVAAGEFGYVPAFLLVGGLEVAIALVAGRAVTRLATPADAVAGD